MKKIGFCNQCLRNVPHVRYFSWPFLQFLNRFPKLMDSMPLASWHCCGCEKNSFRLKFPDPEVTTDVDSVDMSDVEPWPDRMDPNQRYGMLFRRKPKTKILDPSPELDRAVDEPAEFERVGNVTRSDDSLVVRRARASRYSKKFRDGVVDRVLSGQSSISLVRSELDLSERDLLDWVQDRVARQDEHIAKLEQIVEVVEHLTNESSPFPQRSLTIEPGHPSPLESGPSFRVDRAFTIDGEVKRND